MNAVKLHTQKGFFNGWSLTRFISLLLLVNVGITLYAFDISEKETVSILIRSTAKCSFVLFMLAFVASSLHYYLKNPFTNWLLANRRYIGVAFAVSHFIHLGTLLLMTVYIDFNVFEDRGVFRTSVGATAYAFIVLMTITSFDKSRNLFGASNWKPIHTIGGYLLWVIFANSYVLDLTSPLRMLLALLAISVLVLRISLVVRKKL